jgi:hypothetical protein
VWNYCADLHGIAGSRYGKRADVDLMLPCDVKSRGSSRGQEPAPTGSLGDLAVARFTWQPRVWIALSGILVICGSIAAVLAATAQSHKHANRIRQEFKAASTEVAASLRVAIEHEQDLVVSTGAFVASERGTADNVYQAKAAGKDRFQAFASAATAD